MPMNKGLLIRLALTSVASAVGGGAVAAMAVALLAKGMPLFVGLQEALLILLFMLFAGAAGAGIGVTAAGPVIALAGSLMLVLCRRLQLRSTLPWLAAGVVGGTMLVSLMPMRRIVLDLSGWPVLLIAGALGGMASAWLFRRTWLEFAGADDTDIPTF